MEGREICKIVGATIFPNLGGLLGSRITKRNIKTWYEGLKLPNYRPPNYVFPIAWTCLYSGMGYASYLTYRDGAGFDGEAKIPLIVYGTQLALNWAWTPIFFGRHDLKNSAIEIVALTATAATCGVLFFNINKTAGLLFIPYVAWLSFASWLNYVIYRDNKEPNESKDS